MKGKNKIFDDQFYFLKGFFDYKSTPGRLKEIILDCMQKNADRAVKAIVSDITVVLESENVGNKKAGLEEALKIIQQLEINEYL